MTVYPTVADVIETHRRLIDRFGGTPGLRDPAARESAVSRPQAGYCADKRVSITVAAAFLRANGIRLRFDDAEAYRFVIGLYERGELTRDRLTKWLREAAADA